MREEERTWHESGCPALGGDDCECRDDTPLGPINNKPLDVTVTRDGRRLQRAGWREIAMDLLRRLPKELRKHAEDARDGHSVAHRIEGEARKIEKAIKCLRRGGVKPNE